MISTAAAWGYVIIIVLMIGFCFMLEGNNRDIERENRRLRKEIAELERVQRENLRADYEKSRADFWQDRANKLVEKLAEKDKLLKEAKVEKAG